MPEREQKDNHPVRDIVIPLTVIIGLITNALLIGIAWGKFSYRLDVQERATQAEHERNIEQGRDIQSLKDRAHDLERDAVEDRRRFLLLDDFTRGRVSDLPYKPPPPVVW